MFLFKWTDIPDFILVHGNTSWSLRQKCKKYFVKNVFLDLFSQIRARCNSRHIVLQQNASVWTLKKFIWLISHQWKTQIYTSTYSNYLITKWSVMRKQDVNLNLSNLFLKTQTQKQIHPWVAKLRDSRLRQFNFEFQ